MKKKFVLGVMLVSALVVLSTGVALAQSPQPPAPRGGGMGPGGYGPMRFSAGNGEEGPLHQYMLTAMADALGIPADQFETRRAAGETAYQIALTLGFSADEIPALLQQARAAAWDAAAAAGVVSQEQADWMKSRPFGMGTGNCDGTGQRLGAGGMGGWGWQQANP
jgi:hypothetical protein